jgi:hypothetical protein
MPKHALPLGVPILQASDTLELHDFQVFLSRLRRADASKTNDVQASVSPLDVLNVKYMILPRGARPPGESNWRMLEPKGQGDPQGDVRVWLNESPQPRAWLVRQVDVLPVLESSNPTAMARRTDEVVYFQRQLRSFRSTAVVETDDPDLLKVIGANEAAAGIIEDRCKIIHYDPQRIEITADVADSGALLVLSEVFYPGWKATVETEGATGIVDTTLLRTNRVLRGVALPPGRHHVKIIYRPASVLWGGTLSAISWLGLTVWLGFVAASARKRRVQRN